MKNQNKLWDEKLNYYKSQDWIKDPNIFAQFAVKYFPKNSSILELGAGLGQDTAYFEGLGYEVRATDFSETAIDSLLEKFKSNSKITVEKLDMSEPMHLPSQSFDIVYAHLSIHYFTKERTGELFKEIYNCLKPKGILALLLNSTDDPDIPKGKKLEEDYVEFENGMKRRFFSVESVKGFTKDFFEPLVLDNKGETYKDRQKGINNLIRFIGKKL